MNREAAGWLEPLGPGLTLSSCWGLEHSVISALWQGFIDTHPAIGGLKAHQDRSSERVRGDEVGEGLAPEHTTCKCSHTGRGMR